MLACKEMPELMLFSQAECGCFRKTMLESGSVLQPQTMLYFLAEACLSWKRKTAVQQICTFQGRGGEALNILKEMCFCLVILPVQKSHHFTGIYRIYLAVAAQSEELQYSLRCSVSESRCAKMPQESK